MSAIHARSPKAHFGAKTVRHGRRPLRVRIRGMGLGRPLFKRMGSKTGPAVDNKPLALVGRSTARRAVSRRAMLLTTS